MLHKDYDRKYSVEKKNTGRESHGACRQDELTVAVNCQSLSNSDYDSVTDTDVALILKRTKSVIMRTGLTAIL
jgi:hypothetical protein